MLLIAAFVVIAALDFLNGRIISAAIDGMLLLIIILSLIRRFLKQR